MYDRHSSSIPRYAQNAVLQLIVATGTGFIIFHFTRLVMIVYGAMKGPEAVAALTPYVALHDWHDFTSHWWTLLIYNWAHWGFWVWLSNMIWLYSFGTVVQSLVGYRQVIPLFLYGALGGGIFYLLAQLLPFAAFANPSYVLGCQASMMALAVAAITITPKYRFYIGSNFSFPLLLLFILFLVSQVVLTHAQGPALVLLAGGALTGFLYAYALKSGYRPGAWFYHILERFSDDAIDRKAKKPQESMQGRVDAILDKINQKGYNSLSQNEKDLLKQASEQTDKK